MEIVYMGMCTAGFPMKITDDLKKLKENFFKVFGGMQYLENWVQVMDCVREIQEKAGAGFNYAEFQEIIAFFFWDSIASFVEKGKKGDKPDISSVLKDIFKNGLEGKGKISNALNTALDYDPCWDCEAKQLVPFFKQIVDMIQNEKNAATSMYCLIEEVVCYFRQKAWLLWLQSFYSEFIHQQMSKEKKRDGDTLFLAVLPEFSILDYPLDYTSTEAFVQRTMLSEWNIPPRDIAWAFKKERVVLRSFKELTYRYKNLLLIPGTTVWKAQNAEIRSFYNTVLVYWNGNVIKVWDKQLISDVDGICSAHNPRHLQFKYSSEKEPVLYGSVLAGDFLTRIKHGHGYGPTFAIDVFDKKIKFGISVCLDAARPDFFTFDGIPGELDFQILIACGSCMETMLCENGDDKNTPRLRASRGLFYCDAMSMDLFYRRFGRPFAAAWYYDLNSGEIDSDAVTAFVKRQKKLAISINQKGAIQLHRWKDEIKF